MQALQVRRSRHHSLGNDNLAHNCGELIQLAEVHADQAFLLMLRAALLTLCGSGLCGSGGLDGRRGGLCCCDCLGGNGDLRRRGFEVVGLVGPHRTCAPDLRDGLLTVLRVPELHQKAVLYHLLCRGRVAFNARGFKQEVRRRAETLNRAHQHIGPEIFHPAALVEEHPQLVPEIRIPLAAPRHRPRRFRRGDRFRSRGFRSRRRGFL